MYERLTQRTENGGVKFSNGEYWNTVYPQNENCLTDIHRMAIRLCDLEDKIEQGKIVELPCKIGQTEDLLTEIAHLFSELNRRFSEQNRALAKIEKMIEKMGENQNEK